MEEEGEAEAGGVRDTRRDKIVKEGREGQGMVTEGEEEEGGERREERNGRECSLKTTSRETYTRPVS